jgi:hypothetical protein
MVARHASPTYYSIQNTTEGRCENACAGSGVRTAQSEPCDGARGLTKKKVPTAIVQKFLGHKSLTMTYGDAHCATTAT